MLRALLLAALAVLALAPVAPLASAQICPESTGGCPPPCGPSLLACLDPIIACKTLPTEKVGAYAGFTGTSCFGGTAYVCTTYEVTPPTPLLPGHVSCAAQKTVVLP